MDIIFKNVICFAILFFSIDVFCQEADQIGTQKAKTAITSDLLLDWTEVGRPALSNDGKYVMYTVYNDPPGFKNMKTVIKAVNSKWQKELPNVFESEFTDDGTAVIMKIGKDSVAVLILNTDSIRYVHNVSSYTLPPKNKNTWFICKSSANDHSIDIYNFKNKTSLKVDSVEDFIFCGDGNSILIKINDRKAERRTVYVRNLKNGNKKIIWQGAQANDFIFSQDGERLAFLSEDLKDTGLTRNLWLYQQGTEMAVQVDFRTNSIYKINSFMQVANIAPTFSADEEAVFFKLTSKNGDGNKTHLSTMNIWSYKDTLLNIYEYEKRYNYYYTAAVSFQNRNSISLLAGLNESIVSDYKRYALVLNSLGFMATFESFWNKRAKDSYFLVDIRNGLRKQVDINPEHATNISLSPKGKWIIYFDSQTKSYFSYETETGIKRNIVSGVKTTWVVKDEDRIERQLTWMPGTVTWLAGDAALLIYDQSDIWQIDPSCKASPRNLTNGYGEKHDIKFELLWEGEYLQAIDISKHPELYLSAFNRKTKENGFYKITLGKLQDPQELTMGPYIYYMRYVLYENPPVKARDAKVYLVKRMSAKEAPNYYTTTDFSKFSQVSNLQPQKGFNWLTSELIQYNTGDRKTSTGILYKPENFDSSKKYPVIFNYYERRSDELNLYISPAPSDNNINIPYFVSNGYLVFVPDIYYEMGFPGRSAYNYVMSAAKFLATFPYVDSSRMGIQGHSFGGYETNYIVTCTDFFSAACSVSGISDLISYYGSGLRGGFEMYHAERIQGRLGANLWENRDLYLQNSPIFNVNRINTPMLIVHNKRDDVVPFSQSVQLFSALRRLGKRAWMIQYNNSRHSLFDKKDAMDFSARVKQYFDHFLKDGPLPDWMN